jgi:hypothetical protein
MRLQVVTGRVTIRGLGAGGSVLLDSLGLLCPTSGSRIRARTTLPEATKHGHDGTAGTCLLYIEEPEIFFVDEKANWPRNTSEVGYVLVDTLFTHDSNVLFLREVCAQERGVQMGILAGIGYILVHCQKI